MNIWKLLQDTWPDWELIREIGAGSQGRVFMIRLRHSADGSESYAALKVIKLPEVTSGEYQGAGYLQMMLCGATAREVMRFPILRMS